jgi:dienelactone hydrolase
VHVSQVRQASFRGTPDWFRPKLAPAGDRFAAVRWHDGAANVWVGASRSPMQLASDLRPWRLRDFHWGANGHGLILVLSEAGSDKRVLAWLDLRARSVAPLTPDLTGDAQYVGQQGGAKPYVLIAVRPSPAEASRLAAVTLAGAVISEWDPPGTSECDPPGGHATRWLATGTQAVVVCTDSRTCTWWHSKLDRPAWSPMGEIPVADSQSSRPLAFSADGQTLFALSSAARDTVALVSMSAPDWSPEIVHERERFDVTAMLMAPDRTRPELVTTTDPAERQSALTSNGAADLARLAEVAAGARATITGSNADVCLADISFPVGGPAYVTFDRGPGVVAGAGGSKGRGAVSSSVAVSRPMPRFTGLARVRMQPREPISYRARDGLLVTGYVTRPSTSPPWPGVLAVHGGPWARDHAQFDPWAQFLAAAGLCCIQVNYRGSRGFGKRFRDAGDRQWALAMQDDLIDALRSADVASIVDRDRVAAIGHGYGGYAALMLATQTEIPLACVISGSAPTDLPRYVDSLLSVGSAADAEHAGRIGDLIEDRDKLIATSPVFRAADIRVPVLLFHGRKDVRVPVAHAEAFAAALDRMGRSYDLTIYADEGHWLARPQNIVDCRAQCLEFLLRNLTTGAEAALTDDASRGPAQ